MTKAFLIDVSKCCGCYNCQLACKDEHVSNDWMPYAKPQPETGQFWLKIQENVCGTFPKVKMHYVAMLCSHCDKPACMDACAYNAIYKRDNGLVIIDPEICEANPGCKACVAACPYEVIYYNEMLKLAQKCTGCAHLLDSGDKLPRCVEVCPTDAILFGEKKDLQEYLDGAAGLKPESGCGPNVFYRNIPGKFVTGTVFDPVEREVVIGAKCLLTSGGKVTETFTDAYGDFWFKDLAICKCSVSIEAKGFKGKYFSGLSTDRDLNLGDIPLDR